MAPLVRRHFYIGIFVPAGEPKPLDRDALNHEIAHRRKLLIRFVRPENQSFDKRIAEPIPQLLMSDAVNFIQLRENRGNQGSGKLRKRMSALGLVNVGFDPATGAQSVACATGVAPAVLDLAFDVIGQSPGF